MVMCVRMCVCVCECVSVCVHVCVCFPYANMLCGVLAANCREAIRASLHKKLKKVYEQDPYPELTNWGVRPGPMCHKHRGGVWGGSVV